MTSLPDLADGSVDPSRKQKNLRTPSGVRTAIKLVSVFLVIALGLYYWVAVMASPFLISSQMDGVIVRVDGVTYLRGKGDTHLYPWKWVYDVEVETPTKTVRKHLYPWEEGSDSGSIIIDKRGVLFNAETRGISSRRK